MPRFAPPIPAWCRQPWASTARNCATWEPLPATSASGPAAGTSAAASASWPKGPNGEALVPTGENKFHAIFSNGPAYFVSASTLGPALVALGASVTIASASGNRSVPVEKFFVAPTGDGQREIDLKPNEIVTEILIPVPATKNATYEVRQRELVDWPLSAASVALRMNGTTVTSASIALGHVAPTIWRATQAEKMLVGKTITAATAEAAGEAAVANATPLSGNRYKVQLTKVAVKRALLAAAGIKA